jgi:excisionase family DNA binding protein
MITVEQAARRLNVSARRVRALIASKRLSAAKVGRDWLIHEADLGTVMVRPPGRPRRTPKP